MGEIRFVGTGETRGYPYLVCKNYLYQTILKYPHAGKTYGRNMSMFAQSLRAQCDLDLRANEKFLHATHFLVMMLIRAK